MSGQSASKECSTWRTVYGADRDCVSVSSDELRTNAPHANVRRIASQNNEDKINLRISLHPKKSPPSNVTDGHNVYIGKNGNRELLGKLGTTITVPINRPFRVGEFG